MFARRCATVRNRSQPLATVRNRPQPFASVRATVPLVSSAKGVIFWVFQLCVAFAWQAWHFVTFQHVSWSVKIGFVWLAKYCCYVLRRCVAFSLAGATLWTPHFRRVVLRVFCEWHCQRCAKWWQGANSVAGVAFCDMSWKSTEASRETSILRSVRKKTRRKTSIWSCKVWNVRRSRTKCSFWCSNLSRLESLASVVPWQCLWGSCKTSPGCHVVLRGRRGASCQSNMFHDVSSVVFVVSAILLPRFQKMRCSFRGRRSTLDTSWHAQHFRRVVFSVFCKSHCQGCVKWWHSTLRNPHSTLYTLHPTLYTSHFTLSTLHFTLHTLHSTLHSTLYTIHPTLYTLHSTLYTLHPTLYTPHSTLNTCNSTLYTLQSTLYTPYFTHPVSSLITLIPGFFIIRVNIRVRGLHLVFFNGYSREHHMVSMMWRFPKSQGYPQLSSIYRWIFPNKNHPAMEVTPCMETPLSFHYTGWFIGIPLLDYYISLQSPIYWIV